MIKIIFILLLFFNCSHFNIPLITFDIYGEPWTNGIIPYYFGDFTEEQKNIIKQCTYEWEVTGIKFVHTPFNTIYWGDYKNRVVIYPVEKGFSSTVGMSSQMNFVELGKDFKKYENIRRVIIHELGHVIGLGHEHQRPDRDEYITIYWGNIIEGNEFDFIKIDNPLLNESLYEYDFDSVMHYNWQAFSKNKKPTILKKTGMYVHVNNIISEIDIKKVKDIYGIGE